MLCLLALVICINILSLPDLVLSESFHCQTKFSTNFPMDGGVCGSVESHISIGVKKYANIVLGHIFAT